MGSTSARALCVDPDGSVRGRAREPLVSLHPEPGFAQQDIDAVWSAVQRVLADALADARVRPDDVAGLGVTTQRSSVVLWERAGGAPVAPMLLWSDLRGSARAEELVAAGFPVTAQTAASKLEAALALAGDGRARMAAGELCWGTLDSYLVYRLTGGRAHVTDRSCAWPTLYLDFATRNVWNPELIAAQGLDVGMFPEIVDTTGAIAETDARVFGAAVPIAAVIADQQASVLAHGPPSRGRWKATYGTSAVVMTCTGEILGLAAGTTPMIHSSTQGETQYCFEGMVPTAGALFDWLAGDLGLLTSPAQSAELAGSVADTAGVFVRPSLQGLGAPHNDWSQRGLIGGLSAAATRAHIARAALDAVAFRVREIVDTIEAVPNLQVPETLDVDGGASENPYLMQRQADVLQRPLRRHRTRDATALGAAMAAGIGIGRLRPDDLGALAAYDETFEPRRPAAAVDDEFEEWCGRVHAPG